VDWRESGEGPGEQVRANVVIAYDTARMGRRAMRALRPALEKASEPQPAVELRLWRLDLLADRRSKEIAAADVERADMLFLAIEGEDSLPSAMDSWLQVFTSKEEGMRGLALLVGDGESRNDGPTRLAFDDLRAKAEANRVDFMTNFSRCRSASKSEAAFAPSRVPPIFDDFAHAESSRGWGINE
jgi:hypothetical protein